MQSHAAIVGQTEVTENQQKQKQNHLSSDH